MRLFKRRDRIPLNMKSTEGSEGRVGNEGSEGSWARRLRTNDEGEGEVERAETEIALILDRMEGEVEMIGRGESRCDFAACDEAEVAIGSVEASDFTSLSMGSFCPSASLLLVGLRLARVEADVGRLDASRSQIGRAHV